MKSSSKRRANQLRIAGTLVLVFGFVAAFLVGNLVGAVVIKAYGKPAYANMTFTSQTPKVGTTFNWLLAVLVFAPAVVAGAALFSTAEMVLAIGRARRSNRTMELAGAGEDDTV